ncbi:MAG: hypothetical protein K2W97_02010 [Chthoniobacterales bacterium]|nr:hypothetical protein [Chthoniobacterales bacterium]
MKKSYSAFYHFFFITLSVVLLASLFVIAVFSFYNKRQKQKLNDLILQKINSEEREILMLTKQLTDLKSKAITLSKENLTTANSSYILSKIEENNLLSPIDFENEVRNFLAQFEHQTSVKKIALPSNFFSEFERKILYSKKTEKEMQHKQKQFVLMKNILENIILFPKLKIEKFELRDDANNDCTVNRSPLLGTLFISIRTREKYFQKIFNSIISSKYFFIISSITISNSNPVPPLHHSIYSKDKILPILGTETITASLKIDLFNSANISQLSNKLGCEHQKEGYPLFASRHYATKNELLIDPIDYPQRLCPPVSNEWLANNNLDYSNPNILFEDIDHTGFTNLEKWQGDNPQEEPGKFSSDPNDPTSHPLLWTKLKCYQKDITSEIHSIYFLGLESRKKETLFQIQPNSALQSKNRHGKAIFDKKIRSLKMGEQIDGLAYKIVNYQKKQTIYKNTYYDSSELTIEHLNTREQVTLIKKTPYHPQPTQVANITSLKIENTLFNPAHIISLKLGDYFSLDYVLPNNGLADKQNIIETENYQLVGLDSEKLTIERNSIRYKIPITATEKIKLI